ncbi:MAG: hypothetical protein JSU68_10015, partial [Phycisphaerales bacterium]
MLGESGNLQDRVLGQRRPHHVLRRLTQLFSMPVVCVLIIWLWLGFMPAHDAGGVAPTSVAVTSTTSSSADEPKSDDKKTADEKDKDEKDEDNADEKSEKGTEDGESGDKEGDEAKSDEKTSDKAEAEDEKKPKDAKQDEGKKDEGAQKQEEAEGKPKEDKKSPAGTLSEKDLAEMKRILMEKARDRKTQEESKKADEPPAEESEADEEEGSDSEEVEEDEAAELEPATQPASPAKPKPEAPSAEDEEESESADELEPGQDEDEDAEAEEDRSAGKPRSIRPKSRTGRVGGRPSSRSPEATQPPPPSPRIGSRPRATDSEVSGGDDQPSKQTPDRQSRRGRRRETPGRQDQAAAEPREPSIIMPVDLPEGMRAWDMPEDWRPFFFSFENVQWQDVLEDWSRMAGLSILNLDRVKGQLSYEGLDYMNYWEAFGLLNELLAEQNLQLYQDRQHLRVINPSELREYITENATFTSREEFERAQPHDWEPVKVFFVPPPNVAPTQVAQWLNDLPPSALVGAAADGYMHVSANAKDVRKLFRYVDIVEVQAQDRPEPRPMRWIPVENIDVYEAAELARQFVDTQAAAPQPRGRKSPAPSEALDDYAEVEVIAVPASRMILVRAIPAVADRIETLVREIDRRYVDKDDVEPVIIQLEHADAEEIVELLESILSEEPAAAQAKKPTRRRSVGRKTPAAADSEELDLTRAEEDIQLIPDTNTNSIIVIADKRGVERVRRLLTVFDVPGSAPVFERVALQHAEVESVDQVLKTLHGGAKGRKRTEAELTVIPDPAANALFLAGTEDAVGKAREVITQMDVETASAVTHLVTLANQEPSALAKILEQMETGSRRKSKGAPTAGGVNIIGDDATGVLIVICPDNRWPELKDLIERLDRDVSEFQVTRTFRIEGADAEQVGKLLNDMFKGRQPRRKGKAAVPEDLSINVDPTGNLIFVRGDEDTIAEMAVIIAEMEAEAAGRESIRQTFELTYADASETVKALTSFYPATTPGRGKGKRIVPGEAIFAPVGQSVVIVEAMQDKMEEIAGLIAELDREDPDSGTIRSFVVKDADTQQVVRALESMFVQGGRGRKGAAAGGPSFTAAGKKIIVIAEPALFPRIEEAIAQFEGEGTAMEYRRYVVQYADVDELAGLLEDLLTTRAADIEGEAPTGKGRRARGPTSGGVVVSADPRTQTLFVAAPGEVMTYADELIETLDAPQPADLEEVIIRTVQLERADAEEMISSVQQMMTGRSVSRPPRPTGKTKGPTPPRVMQASLTDTMKGEVSMVPALGANAIVLRGIVSDVDQVEELIVTLDGVSQSMKKVARRYDAVPTGLGPDELADTIMAVVDPVKGPRRPGAEDEFAVGPRVGSDLVITTDWYTDTLLVIAAPEKQAEVELLLEALSFETEDEGVPGGSFPIQMVEIQKADPYDVVAALEEIIDEIVERGPKTSVGVVAGTNMIHLTGPSAQLEVLVPIVDRLDKPGRRPPALQIRSVSSPVPLGEALRLVQQQLPDVELVIESEGPLLPGYGVEEVSGVEEITPTLGPNTLAYISAELQRLMMAAGAPEETAQQEPEPAAAEESAAEIPPDAADQTEEEAEEPRPTVRVRIDPETGTIWLSGKARDVESVSGAIDEVLDELKKLPPRPDIRVFRIKYADVNEVAQIMETILGAQSGGAASRAQQLAQQQLRLQQQLLRQRQAQQQQQAQRRMMQQLLGRGGAERGEEEESKDEEAADEEEHEDEPKEFGTTRIRIYPDPRSKTIVVRAATEDYPTIIELIAKIDKEPIRYTEFRIFKLAKLKAADVEAAIKAILRLDRQPTRVTRPTPGQRPGPQGGAQAQMFAQLQQQMDQMAQADAEGALSIDWAAEVTITSDAPTNSILASGPTQAIDYIESMIEKLEGQDIEKEIVKSIQLQHTTVEEALPVLNEIFAARGTTGGAGGRLRMPARQGEQEAVETAFAQVLITGDARTNTLIVKAVEKDMAEVEALIAKLDVDTGEDGRMRPYRLQYADAASMAKSMMDIYGGTDRKASRVKIVADAGTNTILLAAPPALRDEIVAQIESLDRLAGEEGQARTIAVTAGNAETIAQKLQQVFGQRGKLGGEVSIIGDNTSDQLLVRAPDAVFDQIKTLAAALDRGSASTVRVYELEHAVADEVVASMRDAVAQLAARGAGKGTGIEAFSFSPDPRTNSIVVVGDEKTHGFISMVLAQLDVPPKDSTQVVTLIFPLTISDANEVARQVQQLFAG